MVLDCVVSQKDIGGIILEKLEEMQNTEHWFLILDGKLDAETVKKIEKVSYKTEKFEMLEKKKESPIIFSITNKLLQRDKKQLWISYLDLQRQGIPAEEIHGVIFWAVKNMIICSRVSSQKESGLAPYSYSSSLTGSRHFKTEELVQMSSDLVAMIHRVRTGEGDMDVMLEKWMLEV